MSNEIEFMARMAVRVLLTVDGEVTGIELANVQSTITVDDFYSSLDNDEFEQLDQKIRAGNATNKS